MGDEYQIEIGQIRRQLARLKAEEAPRPIIEEYEAELRILKELYTAAVHTLEEGRHDDRLPSALRLLGFGEWTLTNVYSFIYEGAMEAETDGRDLANVIGHTDWAASLRLALEA